MTATPGPRPDELLEAAQGYASQGMAVIPLHAWNPARQTCTCQRPDCGSPGKHPLVGTGVLEATTDQAQLARWWERWRYANIGIATGARSGRWVLDVDDRHGGDDSLADLRREYGHLPDTATVNTGGGGLHLYWKMPPWLISNAVGVLPGIDVRGDGGYVVAPPSRHRSGRLYLWDAGQPEQPAECPRWLLNVLRDARRVAQSAPLPEVFVEGMRDNALTSAAGALRRRGLGEAAILGALRGINDACARPPLPDTDLARIARSVCRYTPPSDTGAYLDPSRLVTAWQPLAPARV